MILISFFVFFCFVLDLSAPFFVSLTAAILFVSLPSIFFFDAYLFKVSFVMFTLPLLAYFLSLM